MARVFRDFFCNDIREREIKERAIQDIGIKEVDLPMFFSSIKEAIKKMSRAGKIECDGIIDKITLQEAIKKYPEIQNQKISDDVIEGDDGYLKAGTVRNWLEVYFQEAGGNRHNSFERSTYLFDSDFVKRLDDEEKFKLGIILKAFDENSLLAIRKEEKEIDFNESAMLDEGKTKLKGIISSYDQEIRSVFDNNVKNNKIDLDNKKNEKIESTPKFDIDEKEKNKEGFLKNNQNVVRLNKDNVLEKKKREIQNVIDLSDYV